MKNRFGPFVMACVAVVAIAWTAPARAGMPSIGFTEVARLRLDGISFFLAGFVLSAAIMRWVWNYLRRDFTWLPKLNFGRACLVVAVWGLLFVIVLAMISGARELMTPGAWKKNLYTYELIEHKEHLNDMEEHKGEAWRERPEALLRLGRALILYAAEHDGEYPPAGDASIPAELWRVPGTGDLKFVYCPGRKRSDGKLPLAYEPSADGGTICVLSASGFITWDAFDNVVRAAQRQDR